MGPGSFIIAILGCADASSACTPVMTVQARFESEAACTAAAPDALLANSNFDFPTLLAECRPTARPASADSPTAKPQGPAARA